MIPVHDERAVPRTAADGVDNPFGIGAIPDQIAEKNQLPDVVKSGVAQTGFKGLAVGVEIRENADSHRRRLYQKRRRPALVFRRHVRYHPAVKATSWRERHTVFLLMVLGLPALSGCLLWLQHLTHWDFLLNLAAIPLEILAGAFLVERWLARTKQKIRRQQLMYLKSYLFRSEMRNVFVSNFSALARPAISLEWIRNASLAELLRARDGITTVEYSSPAAVEEVLGEYVRARRVFQTFMEWAVAHDFELIFHDMIFILHFIQDFQLFKKQNPERLLMEDARSHPRMRAKVDKILRDGIVKFLDYAIELRQKEPEVLEELLDDYLLSSKLRGARRLVVFDTPGDRDQNDSRERRAEAGGECLKS